MKNISRVLLRALFLFNFISCSLLPWYAEDSLNLNPQISKRSYEDHLSTIGNHYKKYGVDKVKKVRSKKAQYLKSLSEKIINANPSFFSEISKRIDLSFYIIDTINPFFFSLPSGEIFFSLGLLRKYVEHESNLMCLLAFELIKISKKVYPKTFHIPTGFVSTPQVLNAIKIPLKDKIEVHKWAIHSLREVGVDENAYLIWLQIMNRNYLDFAVHFGDKNSIFYEESQVKSFIIKNYSSSFDPATQLQSSKDFYNFKALYK